MKERPILFSGEMVRAIREGRKTQTRRIVKASGSWSVEDAGDGSGKKWPGYENEHGDWCDIPCPYGVVGDRLWVRESWAPICEFDPESVGCLYREDPIFDTTEQFEWKWRPSIHMPRWASRITLEITGVRVERLQDISESDAWLEGVRLPDSEMETYYSGFRRLWESISGPGSWALNPWVWVVEFKELVK